MALDKYMHYILEKVIEKGFSLIYLKLGPS